MALLRLRVAHVLDDAGSNRGCSIDTSMNATSDAPTACGPTKTYIGGSPLLLSFRSRSLMGGRKPDPAADFGLRHLCVLLNQSQNLVIPLVRCMVPFVLIDMPAEYFRKNLKAANLLQSDALATLEAEPMASGLPGRTQCSGPPLSTRLLDSAPDDLRSTWRGCSPRNLAASRQRLRACDFALTTRDLGDFDELMRRRALGGPRRRADAAGADHRP
jgi:hypothetical protein